MPSNLPEWTKDFTDYLWTQNDRVVDSALTHRFGDDWRGFHRVVVGKEFAWECTECSAKLSSL